MKRFLEFIVDSFKGLLVILKTPKDKCCLSKHWRSEEMEKLYSVMKDDEKKFEGTYGECFCYVLKHQPQSVKWATTHEGWKIEPIRGMFVAK